MRSDHPKRPLARGLEFYKSRECSSDDVLSNGICVYRANVTVCVAIVAKREKMCRNAGYLQSLV